MKKSIIFSLLLAGLSFTACENFLNCPTEDNYNTSNYYKTDDQCVRGVNYLYNSPWYDFQRGFIKIGEVMSGNMYWGSSPYMTFTTNGTDEDLVNMSCSLWAVVSHCNVVANNINNAEGPSQAAKDQTIGECLAWKAMAYFYLVRTFGEVPIIHDNGAMIGEGNYNTVTKVTRENVYEYIIMTLEKALELLPIATTPNGRIDFYAAEALLAKVYLQRAGVTGSLNNADLVKACEYAQDVIESSGRSLMPNYEDIFRLKNNINSECLISWAWKSPATNWTQQNTLQSDLAMVGFDEFGDCWGGYGGPNYDLQLAFGTTCMDDPTTRIDIDTRRHATMMLPGDTYDYFWQDKGGFDYLRFVFDSEDYGKGGPGGTFQGPCGANNVKHLYGNANDHVQGCGNSADRMASSLATHLLRLADVYLIYAEAMVLQGKGTDAKAVEYFNAVHQRAVPTATPVTELTFDMIWKERRLEFAHEGDRWYDYVRVSYYDVDYAMNDLKAQKRNQVWDTEGAYKSFYETGAWNASGLTYDSDTPVPNITPSIFTLPLPTTDVVFNGNLSSTTKAESIDVRATYNYDNF